jgi:hypothetical protein
LPLWWPDIDPTFDPETGELRRLSEEDEEEEDEEEIAEEEEARKDGNCLAFNSRKFHW